MCWMRAARSPSSKQAISLFRSRYDAGVSTGRAAAASSRNRAGDACPGPPCTRRSARAAARPEPAASGEGAASASRCARIVSRWFPTVTAFASLTISAVSAHGAPPCDARCARRLERRLRGDLAQRRRGRRREAVRTRGGVASSAAWSWRRRPPTQLTHGGLPRGGRGGNFAIGQALRLVLLVFHFDR